jgi:hypothetical protein
MWRDSGIEGARGRLYDLGGGCREKAAALVKSPDRAMSVTLNPAMPVALANDAGLSQF